MCLTKNTEHRTYHEVKNKVTEFHAGNNINLLSYNDSIYEATKINTKRNATLTSTHGCILFHAVQNQALNQTITNTLCIFITQRDKGAYSAVWQLPTIQYGGKLKVNAAQGIKTNVSGQNEQTLKQVIASLGNSPESKWLKVLRDNPDFNWRKVENVYKSWDIRQQQLHSVNAAMIAIEAAASALAIPAGISAASASKGSLAGLDATVLNSSGVVQTARPYNPTYPHLSDGEWQHIVQRVATQSLITSAIDTVLNSGSFKDRLAEALVRQVVSYMLKEYI